MLALLPLVLANWTQPVDNIHKIADSAAIGAKSFDAVADQLADRDMAVARYYLSQRNHIGAINRFKMVVTQYQTSPHVAEALARLAESYLALLSDTPREASVRNRESVASEAQAAVAVLERNFPRSPWSVEAHDALKSAGFEPTEDGHSWISRAFK
jgi:outer membrane protein assembly factor BamD